MRIGKAALANVAAPAELWAGLAKFGWLFWLALGWIGLIVLAKQRRWEALLLATIFLAITAISALLAGSG